MSLDVIVHDTAAPPGPRRRWLRPALAAALVVALAVLVWQAWPQSSGTPLDPDNPDATGTRAVARVLRDQGVQVDVVRTREDLRRARIDAGTTLVATRGPWLTREGLDAVRLRWRGAGQVVLAGMREEELAALQLPLRSGPGDDQPVEASCSATVSGSARRIAPVDSTYLLDVDAGETDVPVGCYQVHDGAALVRLAGTGSHPPVDALAPAGVLTNATVTTQDDAALALHLLGARPHLVWYSPDEDDVRAGDEVTGATRLAPPWWTPLLVLLGGTTLLLALWRGRRLGPLATEPLPVEVPAAETTLARGRLYREAARRGDGRAHAAEVLRAATRDRLARRLGMPRDASTDALVETVAAASRRHTDEVRELLAGAAPTDDPALAALAADLTTLEEEVARP